MDIFLNTSQCSGTGFFPESFLFGDLPCGVYADPNETKCHWAVDLVLFKSYLLICHFVYKLLWLFQF